MKFSYLNDNYNCRSPFKYSTIEKIIVWITKNSKNAGSAFLDLYLVLPPKYLFPEYSVKLKAPIKLNTNENKYAFGKYNIEAVLNVVNIAPNKRTFSIASCFSNLLRFIACKIAPKIVVNRIEQMIILDFENKSISDSSLSEPTLVLGERLSN